MNAHTNCRQTNDFNCIKIKILPTLQIVYPKFYARLPLDSNNLIFKHTGINFANFDLPNERDQNWQNHATKTELGLVASNYP